MPKALDLGNLPSRQGKKVKHELSRPKIARPNLPSSQPSIQVVNVNSSILVDVTPAKTTAPTSSQPPQRVPMNLLENEDLAWERFEKAVTGKDVAACYDMSLKEFEHSSVHDLFKVMSFTSSCFSSMYIVACIYIYIYIYIANSLITCASHVQVHSYV